MTDPQSSKQDKLLKLATDPKILSKAVEGSMEKRLKVMKSQSNSQSGLGGILDTGREEDLEFEAWQKQQLLQLALSCLPDKKVVDPLKDLFYQEHKGFNAAIDTIEQNIRAKFQ